MSFYYTWFVIVILTPHHVFTSIPTKFTTISQLYFTVVLLVILCGEVPIYLELEEEYE